MKKDKKPGIGVGIMVLKRGKILLGKRHGDPQKAKSALHGEGAWTMPGGKLHFGEKLKEAAKREVFEETSIKINQNKLELYNVADDILEDAHFVTIGFIYKNPMGQPKIMEPDEITEWQWLSLDNLPKPIFFCSKKILDKYLKNFK